MTIIAGVAALNMVRGFPQDKSTIVATDASAQYCRMINPGYAGEIAGVVAILTGIKAVDMNNRLAYGDITIVATGTVSGYARVIKYSA